MAFLERIETLKEITQNSGDWRQTLLTNAIGFLAGPGTRATAADVAFQCNEPPDMHPRSSRKCRHSDVILDL